MRIKPLLIAPLFLSACMRAGLEPAPPAKPRLEPPAAAQPACRHHLRNLNRRWTEDDYMCRPDPGQGQ